MKAPKNGYAFVYLSNQSDADVFFDNLLVGVSKGNILEENHYYSYGLKISTLSSTRIGASQEGKLANNYLFQGGFSEIDEIGKYIRNFIEKYQNRLKKDIKFLKSRIRR